VLFEFPCYLPIIFTLTSHKLAPPPNAFLRLIVLLTSRYNGHRSMCTPLFHAPFQNIAPERIHGETLHQQRKHNGRGKSSPETLQLQSRSAFTWGIVLDGGLGGKDPLFFCVHTYTCKNVAPVKIDVCLRLSLCRDGSIRMYPCSKANNTCYLRKT
jgi:hypothetical protein